MRGTRGQIAAVPLRARLVIGLLLAVAVFGLGDTIAAAQEPLITFPRAPALETNQQTAEFLVEVPSPEDYNVLQCTLDDEFTVDCGTPDAPTLVTLSELTEGTHTLA